MQEFQQPERVVNILKKILIMFDHLAAHVNAKPLFIYVEFIAIEHIRKRKVALSYQSRKVYCGLQAKGNRLEIRRAKSGITDKEYR